ncbi:MAG: FkbM family methyltransferase [Rhodospirillales bacterium]|nr:FkbM family methyltransferase [Rhodospirillales bacterium]
MTDNTAQMADISESKLAFMLQHPAMKPLKMLARPFVKTAVQSLINTGVLQNGTTPDGYRFTIPKNMHWDDFIGIYRGTYERHETRLLRDHFKTADTIIDLGSNIGVISRIACEEKLAKTGRIMCVEPNPLSFPALQKNMGRATNNRPDVRIAFINAAIGQTADNDQTAEFLMRNNLSSGLSSHTKRTNRDQIINVPIQSLTNIVKGLLADHFSLIADIEGAEIDLIDHEAAVMERCDQIMIELHKPKLTGRPDTPDMMVRKLEKQGFALRAQSGDCYYLAR